MKYELEGKTVHLLRGGVVHWWQGTIVDTFDLGNEHDVVAMIGLDTGVAIVLPHAVPTGDTWTFRGRRVLVNLPAGTTTRDLELAVYDVLVKHGLLDPLVAILL